MLQPADSHFSIGLPTDSWAEVCSLDNLSKALRKLIRKSGKGAGVDGVSIREFRAANDPFGENGRRLVDQLHAELAAGEYKPLPVKRVKIPKPNGKVRLLSVPTVRDRLVQQAMRQVIEPVAEQVFLPESYAYRPKRSGPDAIEKACELYRAGYVFFGKLDIKGFFDNVDHGVLMNLFRDILGEPAGTDPKIRALIYQFLTAVVLFNGKRVGPVPGLGTPQGGVISPLLANIYLHIFDMLMRAAGYQFVRYADDIAVFGKTRDQVRTAIWRATQILNQLKLEVGKEKTEIVDIRKEPVRFLGMDLQKGKFYVPAGASDKLAQSYADRLSAWQVDQDLPRHPNSLVMSWGSHLKSAENARTVFTSTDRKLHRVWKNISNVDTEHPPILAGIL